MDLKSQKRMAAEILKCGIYRVKIRQSKEVEEALTRQDIRDLIEKGFITKVQKKGTSRVHARKKMAQKARGRQRGPGRRKGAWGTRNKKKALWIRRIRPVRSQLKELRENGRLEEGSYRGLYMMAKGGSFRSRRHLLTHLKEADLLVKTAGKKK